MYLVLGIKCECAAKNALASPLIVVWRPQLPLFSHIQKVIVFLLIVKLLFRERRGGEGRLNLDTNHSTSSVQSQCKVAILSAILSAISSAIMAATTTTTTTTTTMVILKRAVVRLQDT